MKNTNFYGNISLQIVKTEDKSIAKKIFYNGSSRLSRAIYLDDTKIPCFYISHIGGGFLENERYNISTSLHVNAHAVLTNQAPTNIYKCENNGLIEQIGKFIIDENATLEFLNDSLIMFENSNFVQNFDFYLKQDSNLIFSEILTPGYSKDLRHFSYNFLRLKNRIFIDEKLVFLDNLKLQPQKLDLNQMGIFEEFSHLASFIFVSPKITKSIKKDILHLIQTKNISIGISLPLENILIIRILGFSTDELNMVLKQIYDFLRIEILKIPKLNLRKF